MCNVVECQFVLPYLRFALEFEIIKIVIGVVIHQRVVRHIVVESLAIFLIRVEHTSSGQNVRGGSQARLCLYGLVEKLHYVGIRCLKLHLALCSLVVNLSVLAQFGLLQRGKYFQCLLIMPLCIQYLCLLMLVYGQRIQLFGLL